MGCRLSLFGPQRIRPIENGGDAALLWQWRQRYGKGLKD
jgi:hypothetical protein